VWSGKTPFEMKTISAKPDGFEIEFTTPVDKDAAKNATNYEVNGFTYHYHHQYGSEVIQQESCVLKGIVVSEDGLKVRLVLDNLREGFVHEVKLSNIVSNEKINLLHPTGYYTLNAIPSGDKVVLTEAQKVQHHHAMAMPAAVEKKPSPPVKVPAAALAKRQTKMPADWKQPDQVIVIGTKPGLKYDVTSLQVKAGSKVKLVFNNNDDMTHNVVVVQTGAATEVGEAALKLGLKGAEMQYVPVLSKVLYHTNLIQPGTSESIYFIAPTKPGDYAYLCTYPGHAAVMQGTLKVVR
jgi:azurin